MARLLKQLCKAPRTWLGVLTVAFVIVAVLGVFHYIQGRQFDPERWQKAKPFSGDDARQKMVDDLIQSALLVGKTRSEVIQLLGPPSEYLGKMAYCLGSSDDGWFPLSIDNAWLVIEFENGVVRECAVRAD